MSQLSSNYMDILTGLKEKIRQARQKAVIAANTQLLLIYWEIGKTIQAQEKEEGWGAKTVERLSVDLRTEFEDMKGLSPRNLRYMRDFYEAYPDFSMLQQDVAILQATPANSEIIQNQQDIILQAQLAKLPWYHHITLLTKVKDPEIRKFYIQECLENNWSRDIMVVQIESELHKRTGNALNNFSNALPEPYSDLAIATFKNPYLFDFLSMGEKMQERDLEKALITHLKKFMLELGKGFAYVGNQYNLNVEGDDYFLDLLFYNTHLHCYVVFELKIGAFKPEFAGKLNFYINTIDAKVKGREDKPTIGILLCKTPNATVVKYALQNMQAPMGIAEYVLEDALPAQLKGEIPTIEELENEIDESYEELKSPKDKKIEKLKDLVGKLNEPEVKERCTQENTAALFHKVLLPLKHLLEKEVKQEMAQWFEADVVRLFIRDKSYQTEEESIQYFEKELNSYCQRFWLDVRLEGFKKAGTKAFSCSQSIYLVLDNYKYYIGEDVVNQKIWIEKLYHELPTEQELKSIADKIMEKLADDVTNNIERINKEKA